MQICVTHKWISPQKKKYQIQQLAAKHSGICSQMMSSCKCPIDKSRFNSTQFQGKNIFVTSSLQNSITKVDGIHNYICTLYLNSCLCCMFTCFRRECHINSIILFHINVFFWPTVSYKNLMEHQRSSCKNSHVHWITADWLFWSWWVLAYPSSCKNRLANTVCFYSKGVLISVQDHDI